MIKLFESVTDIGEYALKVAHEIMTNYNNNTISKGEAIYKLTDLMNEVKMFDSLDSSTEEEKYQYSLLVLGIKDLINQLKRI